MFHLRDCHFVSWLFGRVFVRQSFEYLHVMDLGDLWSSCWSSLQQRYLATYLHNCHNYIWLHFLYGVFFNWFLFHLASKLFFAKSTSSTRKSTVTFLFHRPPNLVLPSVYVLLIIVSFYQVNLHQKIACSLLSKFKQVTIFIPKWPLTTVHLLTRTNGKIIWPYVWFIK